MRWVATACLIAGCERSPAPPVRGPTPATPIDVAVPTVPRADFVVVPAELGDAGVLDRIPHRARLRAIGDSWLREDGPVTRKKDKLKVNVVLPVLGETYDKVRVAFEDDKVRLALWISKADTWPILAAPTVLADAAGKATRDAGVLAVRGAALHVVEEKPLGSQRRVRLDDPDLTLEGHVPASLIATVWIAGQGDPPPTLATGHDAEWDPPKPQPYTELAKGATVRATPESTAPAITVARSEGVAARLVATRDGYAQIEIVRRYARISGFVLESELAKTPLLLGAKGGGRGHGFGMSHAEQIDVTAGACLFDQLEGEVVGVQVAAATLLGSSRQEKPGWALVHVGTQWVTAQLYIKNLSGDPKQPSWESCTQPAVRK